MTNPLTSFPFATTGTPTPPCVPLSCNRTLPDRIFDLKNVKDFGAKGDGVTDDWAAITKGVLQLADFAINQNQTATLFFPAGTYSISQPIEIGGCYLPMLGVLGGTIITGNFADFLIKQITGQGNGTAIKGLTLVNTNATGGGIRLGDTNGGSIRDCNITANRGISTYLTSNPNDGGSFEISIENCTLSSGSNYAGSQGIETEADGPITNCRFINFETGLQMAGNEGAMVMLGLYFEQCGTGFKPGFWPDGTNDHSGGLVMAGCYFKNCSIGIDIERSVQCQFLGVVIEGNDGQAPGGLNCQYGFKNGDKAGANPGGLSGGMLAGLSVIGKFDQAAIRIVGGASSPQYLFAGAEATNASSTVGAMTWLIEHLTVGGGNPALPLFAACGGTGQPFIYDVVDLWANGIGDCLNVNDGTNGLSWGNIVTNTGTHASHYKCRWNGTNWTVVGA